MSFTGTVVNGTVVFDGPTLPPDGSRVDVQLSLDGDDIGAPPDNETWEEHLAGLHAAHEDVLAGRTRPLEEAMEDIRRKLGLPPFPVNG
jgi:hypothetical protein